MKRLSLLLMAFCLLVTCPQADEARHTFSGDITGVVCAACKAHVTEALTARLPGVEKIDITRGEKEGVNKITIVSKQGDVTKDTAMAALGDLAKNYQILSLEKKQPGS